MNDEASFIRLVDALEARTESHLTLDEVERAAGFSAVEAIADGILLVDYRTRLDGTSVTVCRLNRHHPRVAQLSGW